MWNTRLRPVQSHKIHKSTSQRCDVIASPHNPISVFFLQNSQDCLPYFFPILFVQRYFRVSLRTLNNNHNIRLLYTNILKESTFYHVFFRGTEISKGLHQRSRYLSYITKLSPTYTYTNIYCNTAWHNNYSCQFNICCPRDCVSRHNGGTSVPPLSPSESIVFWEHYRLWGV